MVHCIIQARLGSTRLPGKVLMEIEGKPLIAYLLERLKKCQRVDNIILAIPENDAGEFNGELVADIYTGDELDVASRFAGALKAYPCEAFVRVCGDSPLLDPKLVDEAIRLYKERQPDIACNIHPRTFPRGQCVEVVKTATFLEERVHFSDSHKEHVTSFFYERATDYEIVNFEYHKNVSKNSMVVDTQEDFDRVKNIIGRLNGPHTDFGWQELLLCQF
jgi:spore coat polysaccharide biosynthesis protein SpsF